MKIRNKTLYALTSNFVKSTVELLNRLTVGEALPRREVAKYVHKQNDAFEMYTELEIDFSLLIFKYSKEIGDLQNFKDCAKYVLSNSAIRKKMNLVSEGGRELEGIPLTLDNFMILRSFLGTLLKRVGELSFSEGDFDRSYQEFEHYLYISRIPYTVIAPIFGLSGDIDEVTFDKHLKLRRMSASERTTFMEETTPFASRLAFDMFDVHSSQYVLESDYAKKEHAPMDTRAIVDNFDDAVSVLRLWKSGKICMFGTKTESSIWTPYYGRSYGERFPRHGFVVPSSYVLNKTEKSSLLRLWRRMKDFTKSEGGTKGGKYINIALQRFDLGVEEDNVENKMIDFLISFEALYLNEIDELTYRLSLRTAVLLGSSDAEMAMIRETIAKAYKLRSEIVHGKKLSPIRIKDRVVELGDFVRQVEDYLRKSLRSFLVLSKHYKGQEQTLDLLEKSLTDAKTRKILRKMMKIAL